MGDGFGRNEKMKCANCGEGDTYNTVSGWQPQYIVCEPCEIEGFFERDGWVFKRTIKRLKHLSEKDEANKV